MERLTERLRTGEVLMASDYEEKYTEQEWICVLQDRLAAYEDTGLTPESVEALKLSMMGKAISEVTEFNGLPIDRLRELADADKDWRLVVRCKDCKHSWEDIGGLTCSHGVCVDCVVLGDFYCANGERKDGADNG